MTIKDVAESYMAAGLSVIPVNPATKKPTIQSWEQSKTEIVQHDFTGKTGVALICGMVSGGVECIDFDLKYDLTGTLMDRYKAAVNEVAPGLLKKLVWQKTPTGGFHAFYKCDKPDGNQKLANRSATDEEQKAGDKVMVLIETRGEKGYALVSPTAKYRLISGSFDAIPYIDTSEREILLLAACNFNEVFKEKTNHEVKRMKFDGKSPMDDYNERGDVVGLLVKHGWVIINERGDKVHFRRPGQTSAATSGNFDRGKNWFSVFSTSTVFDAQTPYMPYAVYAVLECGGDYNAAVKRLLDEGYGERKDPEPKKKVDTRKPPSRVNLENPNFDFIAGKEDYYDQITMLANGTMPMGLETGIPELDRYWRFKRGYFVVVNGHDNVGKSVVLWYLLLLAAMRYGWFGKVF